MKQQTKIIALAIFTVLIVGVVAGIAVHNRVNNTPDYYTSIDNPTRDTASDININLVSQETTSIQQENTSQPTENKKPYDNTHNDQASNETPPITYTESPYEKIYVTPDHVSIEQEEYSGKIEIVVGVPYCNCTGTTKLYINGYYQGSGENTGDLKWIWDTFRHVLDLKLFEDGKIIIQVLGKHDELINEFVIIVDNIDDIPLSAIEVFAYYQMDTNRIWFEPSSLTVDNTQQVNFFVPTDSYIVGYEWYKNDVLASTSKSIGITSHTSYTVDLYIILRDGTSHGGNIEVTIYSNVDTPVDDIPSINTPPEIPTISIPKTIDVGEEYTFYARASDANKDDTLWYSFDWGDGFVTIGSALQGKDISAKHTFTTSGIHVLRVHVRDEYGGSNDAKFKITVNKLPEPENSIPQVVVAPIGESLCLANYVYTYTFIGYDSDGNDLWYAIDWGNGKTVEGPFEQGIPVEITHTWRYNGIYKIKYKANDGYGGISDWSASLSVTVLSPIDSLNVTIQYQPGTLSFDTKSITVLNTQQVNFVAPSNIEVAEYKWYKNDVLCSDSLSIGITSLTSYTLGLSITLTDGSSYSDSLLVTVIQ